MGNTNLKMQKMDNQESSVVMVYACKYALETMIDHYVTICKNQ